MPFEYYEGVSSDASMNAKLKRETEAYKKTMQSSGHPVRKQEHISPTAGTHPEGPMSGSLMKWTRSREAMDLIQEAMDEANNGDLMEDPMGAMPDMGGGTGEVDEQKLLEELNKLFTPVLVMQGLEQGITDQANSELSESGVLTEKNMISFDNPTRMAQLIAVCAKLINREKNTPEWQAFYKAAAMKRDMALKMQKNEYDAAKALAQKYLVMVSTTNTSSVARDAAKDLLPQTQH